MSGCNKILQMELQAGQNVLGAARVERAAVVRIGVSGNRPND